MESNINELPKEVLDKIEAKYTKIWYAGTDREWKQQLPCKDAAIFGYSLSQSTIEELCAALKKIRDFDDDSNYDDPGQIAIEALQTFQIK